MNAAALTAALQAVCPLVNGVSIGDPNDRSTWVASYSAVPTNAQAGAVAQAITGWSDPAAPRRAPLSALFDPLSPSQRAAITADHLMRLHAEATAAPPGCADGTVYIGSAKVARAATDMGLTPDAWFKLAGF